MLSCLCVAVTRRRGDGGACDLRCRRDGADGRCARTLATRTLTALEVLAIALGGTLGASRGLGLIQTVERDLTAIVDLDDDDLDLVAHVKDILDLLHAALGDAGDVQQAVLAGQQVDEGAEGWMETTRPVYSSPGSGTLMMSLMRSTAWSTDSPVPADKDGAVLLDVDRGTGLVLDAADDLTTRTDNVADLVGRNLDGDDARSGAARGVARLGDHIEHLLQDEGATLLGLLQGAGQDVEGKTGGLLSICRAVMPSVVPVTLKSMSPRKSSRPWISDRTTVLPSSWIRPMAIPETGRLIGTPPSIRASVEPQVEAIEEEPLDSMTSETTRIA